MRHKRIRIERKSFLLSVKVCADKENGIYTLYAPSLNLSGYGNTAAEAHESFMLSIELFFESISKLSCTKFSFCNQN